MIKSKETRDIEKRNRLRKKANKIYLTENNDDDKNASEESISEMSSDDDSDGIKSENKDSDLEDLIQLEKMEIERRKVAQEDRKRMLRERLNNNEDINVLEDLNEDPDALFDEIDVSMNQALANAGIKQGATKLETI